MNKIPTFEDLLILKILQYDRDIVDGNIIGYLARRKVQKYDNIVRLLRHNNHICYVNDINQSSNLFAALIVTLFTTEHSIWRDI